MRLLLFLFKAGFLDPTLVFEKEQVAAPPWYDLAHDFLYRVASAMGVPAPALIASAALEEILRNAVLGTRFVLTGPLAQNLCFAQALYKGGLDGFATETSG